MEIFEYEGRTDPLLPRRKFFSRLARSGRIAFLLVAVSLLIGMAGYHLLEGLTWIDAFLNASMLLGGMGPVDNPQSFGGKLFAGLYALYCGLVVIVSTGIILAPLAHRVLHRFHAEGREKKGSEQ
ncbi:MAG TPA: hypothetical protein VGI18_01045 [Burkholderiales bacterium]